MKGRVTGVPLISNGRNLGALIVLASSLVAQRLFIDADNVDFELPAHTIIANHEDGQSGVFSPAFHPTDSSLGLPTWNVTDQLIEVPGVSFLSRGLRSREPNLHGFVGDQIEMLWNGLPIQEGSPTRTASPLNFIPGSSHTQIQVSSVQPDLRVGIGSLGGQILLSTFPILENRNSEFSNVHHRLQTSGMSNGTGLCITGNSQLSGNGMNGFISISSLANSDYRAGNGQRVDADYTGRSIEAGFSILISDKSSIEAATLVAKQDLVRNNSLPLDIRDASAWMSSLRYKHRLPNGSWVTDLAFGTFATPMDAGDREMPAALRSIEAQSDSENLRIATSVISRFEQLIVQSGIDFRSRRVNADRTRTTLTHSFIDPLWPDVSSRDLAVFLSLDSGLLKKDWLRWSLQGRIQNRSDRVKRVSDLIQLPVAKGATVLDNWSAYNGSVDNFDSDRWDARVQAGLQLFLSDSLTMETSVGYADVAPLLSYKYRGFVSALGGDGNGGSAFEIGNPNLNSSRQLQVATGLTWQGLFYDVRWSAFYSRIDDFAMRRIIDKTPLVVFGFRAENVSFFGSDLQMVWRLIENDTDRISVPISVNWVEAVSRDDKRELVEVAPLRVRAALRWEHDQMSLEGAFEWTQGKTNPRPESMPIYSSTDSSVLAGIRFRRQLSPEWSIYVAVENLFDETFYNYLQPPVSVGPKPSSGDLSAGDRIPQPGRSFIFEATFEF